MDQEKVGNFIKEIRKRNNLTQKQLADKLNVTYQAVSKWENGKNVPDIAIMMDISKLFNVDIDELLNGENKVKKKKSYKKIYIILSILIIISLIILYLLINNKKSNFEFKMISSDCEDFEIIGSAAYNKDNSSLYISNISYCGDKNEEVYQKLECNLYEEKDNEVKLIRTCDVGKNLTLEKYLEKVKINVNNYKSSCKSFASADLYLEINAYDKNNKLSTYKIPITLQDNCVTQP